MIIGVMSDTHGRLDLMQRALDLMISRFKAEAIVHLGDNYTDAMNMDTRGRPLFAVPGVFEEAWHDSSIPHRLVKDFEGRLFMLSHTPALDSHDGPMDLDPSKARSEYDADALLHGHTHRRRAVTSKDGLIIINPGHLKAEVDRGEPATFAVITITATDLLVRFANMDGAVIDEQLFAISA